MSDRKCTLEFSLLLASPDAKVAKKRHLEEERLCETGDSATSSSPTDKQTLLKVACPAWTFKACVPVGFKCPCRVEISFPSRHFIS